MRAKRYNVTDFYNKNNGIETDGIGGINEYFLDGGHYNKTFACTRFWVYGSKHSKDRGTTSYTYNGKSGSIRHYDLPNGSPQINGLLLLDSQEFAHTEVVFTASCNMNAVLYCFYYHDEPSPYEYIDKNFTNCLPYIDIYVPQITTIDQISGCHFNEIDEDIDYFIRLERGPLFYDNVFQYNQNQNNPPSPIKIVHNNVVITIRNCIFSNLNERANNNGVIFYCGQSYMIEINFASCQFINCGNRKEHSIVLIENPNSKSDFNNCTFRFDNSNNSPKSIDVKCLKCNIYDCEFTNTGRVVLELPTSSTEDTYKRQFQIAKSTFTSSFIFTGDNYPICIDLSIQYASNIIFEDNVIRNMTFTTNESRQRCLIKFDFNDHLDYLDIRNITFSDNVCDCYYGGGSGMNLIDIDKVAFYDCKFINNKAKQNSNPISGSMDVFNDHPYYNGDGGGIQIGFGCNMNEIAVKFENCIFKNNRAHRHGGAIAIQTLKTVDIINCAFENNYANYDFNEQSSKLLSENHFHKKREGRGGAIYINPNYNYNYAGIYCYDKDSYMTNVLIKGCSFSTNSAQDGYAIYIEGDDLGTTFDVQQNNFTNNYNCGSSADSDENLTIRGVIATEIHSFPENAVNTNQFFNVHSKKLVYVDHYGNRIPTKAFTLSNDFTYSSAFSYSKEFSNSDAFTKTNGFTETDAFTKTNEFTKTDAFTFTENFTYSKQFSNSEAFTQSKDFTKTGEFTKTDAFTYTKDFTYSKEFSNSKDFTKSNAFAKTDEFARTSYFSKSDEFSKSNAFGETSMFTSSEKFTKSNDFLPSKKFNPTDKFTKSNDFTQSQKFNPTDKFTKSNDFTQSQKFNPTDKFTKSNDFLPSNKFNPTDKFTKSNDFTQSHKFNPTDKFTKSNDFTQSQKFNPTDNFSPSENLDEIIDKKSSSVSETLTDQPSSISEIITEQPSSISEIITEQPSSISEIITEQPSSISEIITEQPSSISEIITEQPSSVSETAEVSASVSEIITKQPSSISDLITEQPSSETITNNPITKDPPHVPASDTEVVTSSIISSSSLSFSSTQDGAFDNGPNNSEKGSKSFSLPMIIGLVVGILALIAIIIIIIFVVRRKKQNKNELQSEGGASIEMDQSQNSISEAAFDNPLFNPTNIENDPFDQNFDEEL